MRAIRTSTAPPEDFKEMSDAVVRNCEGLLAHRPIRGFMGKMATASQPTPSSDSLVTSSGEDAESRRRPAPAKIGDLNSLEALTDDEANGLGGALLIQASK